MCWPSLEARITYPSVVWWNTGLRVLLMLALVRSTKIGIRPWSLLFLCTTLRIMNTSYLGASQILILLFKYYLNKTSNEVIHILWYEFQVSIFQLCYFRWNTYLIDENHICIFTWWWNNNDIPCATVGLSFCSNLMLLVFTGIIWKISYFWPLRSPTDQQTSY